MTNPGTREPTVTASVARDARRDLGRPDGPRHRARRLGAAGPRQAADHAGPHRGGDPGHSDARRPAAPSSTRAPSCNFPWTTRLDAASLGRGLRTDGARDDRPGRRRPDPPAGRPGPHPLVRRPGPRRRGRGRARPEPRSGSRRRRRPTSATCALCRERTRWFPALVSNHVVDLVNKYPREQLPESLTGYIADRSGYDYHHHAEVGSSNAGFVGDEVTDRFCILGSVEDHVAKLRELEDAGVDQFNFYLMNGDEETQLEIYGREIIPAMRDIAAARSGRRLRDAHAHHQRHDRHRRRLLCRRRPHRWRDDRPDRPRSGCRRASPRTRRSTRPVATSSRAASTSTPTWSCRSAARSRRTRSRPARGPRRSAGRRRSSTSPSSRRARRSAKASTPGTRRPRATRSPTTAST